MLRIPDHFLDCSLYVYESIETAKGTKPSGASGFLVCVPLSVNTKESQPYVVTNRHVIDNVPSPVLRLNTINGSTEFLQTNGLRWVINGEDDLAVLPLDVMEENYRMTYVSVSAFMTTAIATGRNIGPGDEAFMVGRFVSHEGTQRNTPTVRFGNIAMTPQEPMQNAFGNLQETFLVECRSIPGFSGSPVFVYIDPTLPRAPYWATPAMPVYQPEWHGPWLLGIDWCHIHDYEPLYQADKETRTSPAQWVKSHSGMAGVIPAWRLRALLETDELVKQRKQKDERITAEKNSDLKS